MTEEQKEQARQARNEYLRQWRKKNPLKQQEYMSRYWLRKFEGSVK